MNSATRTPAAASLWQAGARVAMPATHVQAPFGGQFGATLGHQAAVGRLHLAGEGQHRFGGGHFQVHPGGQEPAQRAHVALLDMTAVFAKVQRDVVGPGLLGDQGGVRPGPDSACRAAGGASRRDRC